jgi:hypothetical protein
MEALIIEKTKTTPKVVMDKNTGVFEISGRSLPEDAVGFYQPVVGWLEDYFKDPNPSSTFVFSFDYFNTASSKIIFEIIKSLNVPKSKGVDVNVCWRYLEEDVDTLEAGKDYASLVNVPFSFVAYME